MSTANHYSKWGTLLQKSNNGTQFKYRVMTETDGKQGNVNMHFSAVSYQPRHQKRVSSGHIEKERSRLASEVAHTICMHL